MQVSTGLPPMVPTFGLKPKCGGEYHPKHAPSFISKIFRFDQRRLSRRDYYNAKNIITSDLCLWRLPDHHSIEFRHWCERFVCSVDHYHDFPSRVRHVDQVLCAIATI